MNEKKIQEETKKINGRGRRALRLGVNIFVYTFVGIFMLLMIFFGIRPLVRALSQSVNTDIAGRLDGSSGIASNQPEITVLEDNTQVSEGVASGDSINNAQLGQQPAERLRTLAKLDPDKAVNVIRGWLAEEAA